MAVEIFKCVNDGMDKIPKEAIQGLDIEFPKVHIDAYEMARMSKAIKEYRKDNLCRVPFCNTVEGEALGSIIKLGDENTGPRVEKYLINSIEDIEKTKSMDFTKGRIEQVLKAVSILSNQGETVCLAVEGPFTIANSLMDTALFYKFLRKEKERMNDFFKLLENDIAKYILKGIDKGANIISYADPVGTVDIVGPKVYREVSGRITYNILKALEGNLKNSVIHICGKTSTSLESIGLAENIPIEIPNDIPYGQILKNIDFSKSGIKFIGNWCIKRSGLNKKDGILWQLKFICES